MVRVHWLHQVLSLRNVNLVDGLIWSQEAVGSNPTVETNFALLFQRLEFRFCSPAMAVRVRHGAPHKENIMAVFVVLVIMFVLYQILKKY